MLTCREKTGVFTHHVHLFLFYHEYLECFSTVSEHEMLCVFNCICNCNFELDSNEKHIPSNHHFYCDDYNFRRVCMNSYHFYERKRRRGCSYNLVFESALSKAFDSVDIFEFLYRRHL